MVGLRVNGDAVSSVDPNGPGGWIIDDPLKVQFGVKGVFLEEGEGFEYLSHLETAMPFLAHYPFDYLNTLNIEYMTFDFHGTLCCYTSNPKVLCYAQSQDRNGN